MVTLALGYYFGSAAGEKQAEASRIEKEAVRKTAKTTLSDVDRLNDELTRNRRETKTFKGEPKTRH